MERCEKCGSQKILKNDVLECIFCIGKKQGVAKKGYIPAVDPGEKYFTNGKAQTGAVQVSSKSVITNRNYHTANEALDIMKQLPMPTDIKKFKQITKIIAQIEKLIEV